MVVPYTHIEVREMLTAYFVKIYFLKFTKNKICNRWFYNVTGLRGSSGDTVMVKDA